ncbi:nucleoside phosphorylase [Lacrimispora sp. NSJ-141]|uniref:Uridine phosphorylase n=1 Tax=Lientehia hominis TaxID=2897778 RepID=A0AAP2RIR8_9FIRM|nr:nucleoside phosphorylase [Lientehia hominis]MCD2492586.1 nucleoside phosphorylase [Lientehia hominis]
MNTVFYKEQPSPTAFINPTDLTEPAEDFPEICISTFSKQIIDKFAGLDGVKIIAHLYTANGKNPIYKITYGGKEIAFYLSLVGAPASVCGLEEVIALGARKFVFFGCCGILDDSAVNDRLIIPSAAIREEGTSYHYLPPSDEIKSDPETIRILEDCLKKCGYPYVTGKIWTTDAIYRETPDAIQTYKNLGCLGVDMEYSALLAVSKYRRVRFAQFFYGADNLDSEEWQPRDLTEYGLHHSEKYLALALECGLAL